MGTSAPTAQHFGSYGAPSRQFGCDAPAVLVVEFSLLFVFFFSFLIFFFKNKKESALNFVSEFQFPITALFLTGDYVSHDIWQNNVTEMESELQFVTQLVRSTLPNVTFLPISGNHEWFPTDQVRWGKKNRLDCCADFFLSLSFPKLALKLELKICSTITLICGAFSERSKQVGYAKVDFIQRALSPVCDTLV